MTARRRTARRIGPALACGLALAGCKPGADADEDAHAAAPVRPVLTTQVRVADTVLFGPFAGLVEARYRSQLGFQIGGRVVARDVTVGDVVRKGQRLAALDPTVTRFALARAQAEVADAKAQAENAGATETRVRRLLEGSNVSQAQLDAAVAGRETTQARLAQVEASLQKVRDQMGWTELRADFDGVVTERLAEVGQVLSAGQGVVTLARPEVREAVVDIPEDLAGAMPRDGAFTVTLQSAPAITTTGRVREIAPFADAGTRTRHVRMSLTDPPAAFRLGATITVVLARKVAPHVDVPAAALFQTDGGDAVWIVAPDGRAVHRRAVTQAHADGERAERETVRLRAGVEPGERVVIAGVHSLVEGQAVRLADGAR